MFVKPICRIGTKSGALADVRAICRRCGLFLSRLEPRMHCGRRLHLDLGTLKDSRFEGDGFHRSRGESQHVAAFPDFPSPRP